MTLAELKEPDGSLAAKPRLLVVCCPSGVGLDPVMQSLLEGYPNSLCRVVSHTSRVPLVSLLCCAVLALSCHDSLPA